MRLVEASATAAIMLAAPGLARGDCVKPALIFFPKNLNTAARTGGIVRAEDVCYALSARAGQHLKLSLKSPDGNVVVAVYMPGYKVIPASDGPNISGKTLPGAADQDEARNLTAILPVMGRYLLVLGTTRGAGGDYKLQIGVR